MNDKYIVINGDKYETGFETFNTLKEAREYAKKNNKHTTFCYICKIIEEVKEQK